MATDIGQGQGIGHIHLHGHLGENDILGQNQDHQIDARATDQTGDIHDIGHLLLQDLGGQEKGQGHQNIGRTKNLIDTIHHHLNIKDIGQGHEKERKNQRNPSIPNIVPNLGR